MSPSRRSIATAWAGVLLAAVAVEPPALACAPAPPPGAFVSIDEEEALIVWDAASRTQHFVRRARFSSTARDFGFLVPTPTRPELAEAPDEVFARLDEATRPAVVRSSRFAGIEPFSFCLGFFLMSRGGEKAALAPPPVRVLEERRVAGYDAAVLEADDPAALNRWLGDHGYASRPALTTWLAPYVAAKWKVTAFKVAPEARPDDATPSGPRLRALATTAVRMSFTTDRPFFPYREPEDVGFPPDALAPGEQAQGRVQRSPEEARGRRRLRVFFVGTGRVGGTLGDGRGAAWPGRAVYAQPLPALGSMVGAALPARGGSLPDGAWLTELVDESSPRPGTDEVWFAPSSDASPLAPPPIEEVETWKIPLPVELILLLGAALTVRTIRRRRRRRAAAR